MKKNKVSKIMLMIAVVAIICCISGINQATSNLNDIMGNGDDQISDIPQIPGGNSTQNPDNGNNTPTTPIGGNTTGNTTRNITANTNTALPKAGANDTLLFGLIAVSAVAAIYTYKKVRDYTA